MSQSKVQIDNLATLPCAGLSLSTWNLDLCVRIMTDLSEPGNGMQYLPSSSFQKRDPRGRSLGEVCGSRPG